MEVHSYVLWYETLDDGWVTRRHGRVVSLYEDLVYVNYRHRILVLKVADVAASAPTLSKLDYELQILRETHPCEARIKLQWQERYGAMAEVRTVRA